MNTNTLPKEALVERLTKRMDIHRIFLFSYPFMEEERQHLLLVINPVKGMAPNALAPVVSLCFSDTAAIPFDMVITGEWQNQLKHGSLYYTYASLPEHELYAATKKGTPLFSHKSITGLLELAALNYDKARQHSDEFRIGVDNYVAKGEYGQATFMLHQFLEFRLKGFLMTAGINGGKTHNVEHLMKRLPDMAPQLKTIFPYDSASVDLFRLLDESYTKAKKQETIAITAEEFNVLLQKGELAAQEMDRMVLMMADRIKAYQEQLPKEQALPTEKPQVATERVSVSQAEAQPPTVSKQVICEDFSGFPWPDKYKRDVQALLDRIYQTHRPEQIILLNYRTGGFSGNFFAAPAEAETAETSKVELYLVVVKNNKGPFNFQCMRQGDASAMVLFRNVDKIKNRLSAGNRFVHRLWTKGLVLRKKSTFNPDFPVAEVDWDAEYKQAKETWENARACMDNVNQLIQSTRGIKLDTGLLLINNLLQMGVRTYLRCAVGYIPYDVHLVELMDWSCVVDNKLVEYFHPKTDIEKESFRLAAVSEGVWWQNIPLGLSNTPLTLHRNRAAEIMRFFEGLMEEVLTGMKGENDSSKDK